MRKSYRLAALFGAVAVLVGLGVTQLAGAQALEEGQSAILCHATPPDDPNKFEVIVTDDQGFLDGHLQQHDADILIAIVDKPPDQVTKEERDAALAECEEQITPPPTTPPPTTPPPAPETTAPPVTG